MCLRTTPTSSTTPDLEVTVLSEDDDTGDMVAAFEFILDESAADLCPADLNGDGEVGVNEILTIIEVWGTDDADADITGDGIVGVDDLLTRDQRLGPLPVTPTHNPPPHSTSVFHGLAFSLWHKDLRHIWVVCPLPRPHYYPTLRPDFYRPFVPGIKCFPQSKIDPNPSPAGPPISLFS